MRFKLLLEKLLQNNTPSLVEEEQGKRRAATLYFVLLLLLFAFCILLAAAIHGHKSDAIGGLLAAQALLLSGLLFTWRGHYSLPSHAVPLGLLLINTSLTASSQGIHDITILGFPLIIALAGLLLGKRGSLFYAAASIVCLYGIYWVEIITTGKGFSGGEFILYIFSGDLFVLAILLGLTAGLIYFATNNLTLSLESTQKSEQATRLAKEELERYTRILETRTQQLITGTKVSRVASSILDPDDLAQQVVDLVSISFELYYVCLFLLDKKGEWAVLHAATGDAGKEMLKKGFRLRVGSTSMIGWCLANQKARIASDVGKEAVRFDNPLLPRTHSELALPLISQGQIIGALGIQSDKESAFSEEDIATFQSMADQLAIAISNARHYAQLQRELVERKRVEKKIRKLNIELEARVEERTSELQDANEHLTSLSRLKDEFIANVSHELRTPITSIMLYHSMIEARPEDALQYVVHLKRETDRLARLIEDLLYISRLEQGHTNINLDRVDITRLARDFITDRTPLAHRNQLNLTLKSQPALPAIHADEKLVGQVLSILLTNAMTYTPPGGTVIVETLQDHHDDQHWVGFSVSDTGPGIDIKEQQRIFERFYRGKAGHESKSAGTGLGLSIARAIIEKHHGRIEVQSNGVEGQGTIFTVWLPVTPQQDE